MNKILLLSAHTDDFEFGCSGTVFKWLENTNEFFSFCFSDCGKNELSDEYFCSLDRLGIEGKLRNYNFRTFSDHRQNILQEMIDLEYDPDIVFCPSSFDFHPDHEVINREAIRAFKNCTILGYDFIWNELESKKQCTIELTKEQVEKKIEACGMYKSQAHRPYMNPEFIRSWAKMRGVQNGCDYAEVFEVIKLRL